MMIVDSGLLFWGHPVYRTLTRITTKAYTGSLYMRVVKWLQ